LAEQSEMGVQNLTLLHEVEGIGEDRIVSKSALEQLIEGQAMIMSLYAFA
jgi:hypothetical protein